MSFQSSLSGRSVFVTGHTGFKGSWLCLWLERLGARVAGYSLAPPTDPSHFEVASIRELLDAHHEADLRDHDRLDAALAQAQPDLVFHLAAQSVVIEGYRQPRDTFETNVIGTGNVLEGVGKLGKPCVVVSVSSDKCYENREQVWGYREDDAFGGHDPYSASKGAAEILTWSYQRSFFPPERVAEHGLKIASARAGNVLGGGDWTPHALIVDMMRAFSEGRKVELRSPNACRPWQHVLQALSGYLTLAQRMLDSDEAELCSGWNIGPAPGEERSVSEVADLFARAWSAGSTRAAPGWKDASCGEQLHEAETLRLSIDKAVAKLGWKPLWNVDETLTRTAEWYKRYQAGEGGMREFGLEQIAAYEADMERDAAPGKSA